MNSQIFTQESKSAKMIPKPSSLTGTLLSPSLVQGAASPIPVRVPLVNVNSRPNSLGVTLPSRETNDISNVPSETEEPDCCCNVLACLGAFSRSVVNCCSIIFCNKNTQEQEDDEMIGIKNRNNLQTLDLEQSFALWRHFVDKLAQTPTESEFIKIRTQLSNHIGKKPQFEELSQQLFIKELAALIRSYYESISVEALQQSINAALNADETALNLFVFSPSSNSNLTMLRQELNASVRTDPNQHLLGINSNYFEMSESEFIYFISILFEKYFC